MPVRDDVLQEANKIVSADREATYGPPKENFKAIGDLQYSYSNLVEDRAPSEEWRTAMNMALLKLARIATGPQHKRDNYIDACGYLALACELAEDD
jgi:hypothetical protein|tara:strand:+ start:7696 stop:7983 length:288 start_codon:yes stop_codon:yes gene_type:complete